MKSYTFTVEEIVFDLYYTNYVQSHAEDCLHETPEPVSLPFDCVNPQKCRKSPLSVFSFLARMVNRKAQNNSPAATGVSLETTLQ